MLEQEINSILNMNIPNFKKSEMIQILIDQKNSNVKMFEEGGQVGISYDKEISISGKPYKVAIAKTEEEKETGLSKINSLPEGCGMLFVYEKPQEDLWFTMADTSIDLDIIFIDEEGTVTQVSSVSAHDPYPIIDRKGNAQFVLELNVNSGIRRGDELDDYDDDEDEEELTPEEKETAKQSKMLVLDENGDVQMKLEGGERIFSRISTRKFIKAAVKAFRSDKDTDYIKVGKLVFNELNAQDNRTPEYVESPK